MPALWYAFYTEANLELTAAENVERKGYPVCMPRRLVRVSHARKIEIVERSLFGRYGFFQDDLAANRWGELNYVRGVREVLCTSGQPREVPTAHVAMLLKAQSAGDFDETKRGKWSGFRVGQAVRITSGAFIDLTGVYSAKIKKNEVKVLVNVFGRLVEITIDPLQLEII
jgi:transcription antitermination factor NusG